MSEFDRGLAKAEEILDAMVASGEWEGQYSLGFAATFIQELDEAREDGTD
jgi:hypothetical protein